MEKCEPYLSILSITPSPVLELTWRSTYWRWRMAHYNSGQSYRRMSGTSSPCNGVHDNGNKGNNTEFSFGRIVKRAFFHITLTIIVSFKHELPDFHFVINLIYLLNDENSSTAIIIEKCSRFTVSLYRCKVYQTILLLLYKGLVW